MTETERAADTAATLPDLELALPDGRPCRLSDYRGEGNQVILISGGAECGPCRHAIMSDLCVRPEEYTEAGATAVLVLHCSPIEAELVRRREDLALPVLIDPAGKACLWAGAQTPEGRAATAIVVTDGTGRICLQSRPDQNGLPPTREAIFRCLRSIPRPSSTNQER